MEWVGSFSGCQEGRSRRYIIGDTVVAGQIGCWTGLAGNGVLGDPASVNDYSAALGVIVEAVTVSTTQGAGGRVAECTNDPLQIIRGLVSGGATASTDQQTGTDGNLLTNDTASAGGLLVTEADVGTSEYVGGFLVGLTGDNAGHARIIDAHTDNTSTAVVDPFDNAIAVGDTFLRTFGELLQGVELTTDYTQFNGVLGAGVDLPDTGTGAVVNVLVDGQKILVDTGVAGQRNPYISIENATNPVIEIDIVLIDHAFNSVA